MPPSLRNAFNNVMRSLEEIEGMVRAAYHEKGAQWRTELDRAMFFEVSLKPTDDDPTSLYPTSLLKHVQLETDTSILKLPAIDTSAKDDDTSPNDSILTAVVYFSETMQGVEGAPNIDRTRFENTLRTWCDNIDKFLSYEPNVAIHVPGDSNSNAPIPSSVSKWEEDVVPTNSEGSVSLLFSLAEPEMTVLVKPVGVSARSKSVYSQNKISSDPAGRSSFQKGYRGSTEPNEDPHERLLKEMRALNNEMGSILESLPQDWPVETVWGTAPP